MTDLRRRRSSGIEPRARELSEEEPEHPSPEQIAALVEHRVDDSTARVLQDHLSTCRRCFALYSELVHVVTGSPLVISATGPPDEWIRLGRSIAASEGPVGRSSAYPDRRFLLRPTMAMGALASLALLAGAALLWRPISPADPVPLSDRTAISVASSRVIPTGWLVFDSPPRVRELPVYRSGEQRAVELDQIVEHLAGSYEKPSARSEPLAGWLATGYLADGDRRGARIVLDDARRRWPGSVRLAALDALLEFQESRLDRAEAKLRQALDLNPGDPVLTVDLAVVLSGSGRSAESRTILRELAGRLKGRHPLRAHVEAVLSHVED